MEKVRIANGKQRRETLALLNIPESEWADYPTMTPMVWLLRYAEDKSDVGEVFQTIGLEDFETPDFIIKARAVLEWLNQDQFDTGFPVHQMQNVSTMTRRLALYSADLGNFLGALKKEKKKSEFLLERMKAVLFLEIKSTRADLNTTEIRAERDVQLKEYQDRVAQASSDVVQAESLQKAISGMLVTLATTNAQLRKEYELVHLQEGA